MKQKHFLLIDDDADDRFLFGNALKIIDPQIVYYTAEHGKDAFKVLAEKEHFLPDIIFLDINMAEMDGWECLTLLKKDERYKNIPVIMYSTSNHEKDIKLAFELGAICFCTKPEDYDHLITILTYINEHLHLDLTKALQKDSITDLPLTKYLTAR